MRILVLGDFHGKFSEKLRRKIAREDFDVIVSLGDYLPFYYRKIWFKHCYGKDVQLWEIIGKQKYKKLVIKDQDDGEKVLRKLSSLDLPVFSVLGNVDNPEANDVMDEKKLKGDRYWAWEYSRSAQFANRIKKYEGIKRIDYSYIKVGNIIFIGARGHSFPGRVKSRAFRKHKKILEKLFRKFRKENKEGKVIFVSHNVPYNTKLDKLSMKADKEVRGKHYGSKLVRGIIDKFHPKLAIGGHIHEGKGMQKLGKSLIINPGDVASGKYAVVDYPDNGKGKIKVKFVK